MKDARRPLTFAALGDVMPDVDRLPLGHTTVGTWSLGQICSHLAQALHFTMNNFPPEAHPPWLIQKTVGRFLLWRILRTGRFTEGLKMPKKYEPPAVTDARTEAESLRAALQRFASHTGPLATHPIIGRPVSRDVWERFHCIHNAHHLRFALPTEPGDKNGAAGSAGA